MKTLVTTNNAQSVNNDGLTKQQLDLIHQIMQQTQQGQTTPLQKQQKTGNNNVASATVNNNNSTNTTSKVVTTAPGKTKAWALQLRTYAYAHTPTELDKENKEGRKENTGEREIRERKGERILSIKVFRVKIFLPTEVSQVIKTNISDSR
ncbi:hypothetical protein Phum_PHUM452750 [Pediculus humanus corporis]|uniref:Uncharacterized protein n=1 Tax=Pediculus humanus subsp. corporis TaxID=121224 RepID=E0VUN8_PEDHC|nr:uncharacterized protein Phum_PHUM452750 [Pediculus humanus corporis]EEB17094.1 hypothetical protein Phum_PHUM452750 [Pediculus humanus corporis]